MEQVVRGVQPPVSSAPSLAGSRAKLLLAGAVLLAAFGYFAFMAFKSASVYYYTVGEITQSGPTVPGKIVRVSGKLVQGSFVREPGSTQARFVLTDGQRSIQAVHDGVVPDLFFNEHSNIILEGAYDGGGGFASQNVIVQCPSKYIAAD